MCTKGDFTTQAHGPTGPLKKRLAGYNPGMPPDTPQPTIALPPLLEQAWQARAAALDAQHQEARRLFNGFLEGCPDLVADLYGATLLLVDFSEQGPGTQAGLPPMIQEALDFYLPRLSWLKCVVLQARRTERPGGRSGLVIWGKMPCDRVQEAGVWYALDLMLNQDASFYPDTRLLRAWLLENAPGKRVLNTFAYTGSLGVAARAAGASQVVQTDRSARFLEIARRSLALNGLQPQPGELRPGDFFSVTRHLRRSGMLFDIVIIDPPFFSTGRQGRVDLNDHSIALINKVRPLVADGGRLVAVNNALYVSGQAYLDALQTLCADGYISLESSIPIPEDITGSPATRRGHLPTDPAPFNHATKIAVLHVRRKN